MNRPIAYLAILLCCAAWPSMNMGGGVPAAAGGGSFGLVGTDVCQSSSVGSGGLSCGPPTSYSSGDLIFAHATAEADPGACDIDCPGGWTSAAEANASAYQRDVHICYKTASASESSATWGTSSTNCSNAAIILSVWENWTAVASASAVTSFSTTESPPDATTDGDTEAVIAGCGLQEDGLNSWAANTVPATPATGWTHLDDEQTNNLKLTSAYRTSSFSNPIGEFTDTATANGGRGCFSAVIE